MVKRDHLPCEQKIAFGISQFIKLIRIILFGYYPFSFDNLEGKCSGKPLW